MTDTSALRSGIDRSAVDPSIRLADDLFGHVNGTWLREYAMPADRSSDGEFRRLRDLSEELVHRIVEDAAADADADPSSEHGMIGVLHRLFMDTDAIEEKGLVPLEPLLDEIADASDRSAITRLMASPEMGTSLLLSYVWTDNRDSTQHQVKLHQGGIGLPDESYYREDAYADVREKYVAHLATMADLAGLPGRAGLVAGDAQAMAAAVMQLETAIAGAHVDRVRVRDAEKSENPADDAARRSMLPGFDWDAFIEGTGAQAGAFDEVNVGQPEFLEAVAPIWRDADDAVLRTWLSIHAVTAFAAFLPERFVEAEFDFTGRVLSGSEELRERWKRSVAFVEGTVGFAVGKEYVQRHFPTENKERMDALVRDLLEAYRASISQLDWMTPTTREKALEKLEKFTPKIGYPDEWRDYAGLELDPTDLIASVRASRRYAAAYEYAKVGREVDPHEWHMTPQTVNAYYNPGANEIVFPAAILQPPFFDAEADDAVNFGGIGAVIGHEIGHGFDDQGSKYDGDGNLRSWWTAEDRAEFEKRTGALIDQFSALSPRDLDASHTVSGGLTIGENIGDLGGLSIALKAYLAKHPDGRGPEIDGMTGVQRLFWSWATVWRGKNRTQEAIQRLATDPHAPAEFRCNIPVGHIDEFYEAFDVREGDGLYIDPLERVRIW